MKTANQKLVDLLDYVEQVVRLDERVAFRLADYRLADGTAFVLRDAEIDGLPGLHLDERDEDGAVWLRAERLARHAAPDVPARLAPWLVAGADPMAPPTILDERLDTVSAEARNALLAAGEADEEDFSAVPEPLAASCGPPRFDRRLALAPAERAAAEAWIAGPWQAWSDAEAPRRRTIALYGALYRLQQQLELGGAESAVEAVWGIGPVQWASSARGIDRPLIERTVELELDADGTIRVRPRAVPARFDLKPYDELGCPNLNQLDEALRREIERTAEDEGMTPFRATSFEPSLLAAATRLAPNGRYVPSRRPTAPEGDGPVITDGWVLFARPRSRHVVLDDIARFRDLAKQASTLNGLAARLVTPPAAANAEPWRPLGDRLGTLEEAGAPAEAAPLTDVFFPKPFNEDQIAIVRRLAAGDGLVVQGPPGTGKTHTIANLICHAMALGQRVLVVSRGEAALAVLRDLLPEKVRPLAISILSSERAGLRQVETAIREIQSVVEESRPEIRQSAIRRCEAEILKIRARLDAIDHELDAIADWQTAPLGPSATPPADLARTLQAARERHAWFTDRPEAFAAETGLDEAMLALHRARRAAGVLIDHVDATLPSPETLPDAATVAAWHDDLRHADALREAAASGPARALRIPSDRVDQAQGAARALRDLATARDVATHQAWLIPVLEAGATGVASPWLDMLRDIVSDFRTAEAERIRLAPFAIEIPERLLDDEIARAAIDRAAAGERPWGRIAIGRSLSRDLVGKVRLRGLPPREDSMSWRAVADHLRLQDERHALAARWRSFAAEAGLLPGDDPGNSAPAAHYLATLDRATAGLEFFATVARALPTLAAIATDPGLARALADQVEGAVAAARLAAADAARAAVAASFTGDDRTSRMARQFLGDLIGRTDVEPARIEGLWTALVGRIASVAGAAAEFATIVDVTGRIAAAGAPAWAGRLRSEPVEGETDPLLPDDWREAWDAGAGEAHLERIDGRTALLALSREREAADRRARKLFVELVRERAFMALERRLSPQVKSALVEYVRALGRLGKGTGKGAGRHRRTAREAMDRCYDAVPCWIMPTWRVAEQLPADLAAFDLVILDEASQSDVTELPALLRGKKILAVGDDRQVSPTPPFVTQARLEQLRHHYLRDLPFASLLEPGESLYDLLRAVFPDSRLMLKEHFRCVEPIIRFSMRFYPERLVPLRVPSAAERLDPPLVDILVPHGMRDGARKINRAEAEVIVAEIAGIASAPHHAGRSIGVISLIGGEQAELIRVMLAERIGEEAMQHHKILAGDSAAFQGNERDIVFLSMVADRKRRSTLTMLRYEQRFNVAVSRARDRVVLVRSVSLDDLNPKDLKARLIAHFDDPMPARPGGAGDEAACESAFERDMMRALVGRGYRVEPQVGAEGFRIDLVVEGTEGRRLAVECDGDSFHGPAQWREDMRRQRILERVGWRFWRCFASNFYRDPEGVVADLVATLDQERIEPLDGAAGAGRLTEHRVVAPPPSAASGEAPPRPDTDAAEPDALKAGDRLALVFDDRKRLTIRLTEDATDEGRGLVGRQTPLGRVLTSAEEGDEIELPFGDGPPARALIEAVERARS
ncbi:MAG TPA: AAA domain-containing protein [Lichenihabitans sp.]|nr:AAA domain-containing protein [Lichenihabitans sp.]